MGFDRYRRETKNQTSTTTKVINKKYSSDTAKRLSVYIGRPTKWGNPFPLRGEWNRDNVCEQYERYMATRLINGDIVDEDFREFDGKNLMCFCAPLRCHGDTLVKLYYMSHEERLEWARAKVSADDSRLESKE